MRSHKLAAEPNLAVSCSHRLQSLRGNGLRVAAMMLGFENSIETMHSNRQKTAKNYSILSATWAA
jgi:O-glycosyl hydrolase